jgi:glycosyltransferase involved in cell wall biosynthesis
MAVRRFAYGWPARTQRLAEGAILPNLQRRRALLAQVPVFVLAELTAAWRLLRAGRFHAMHAHWVLPQGAVAASLRARAGVPLLTTSHGSDLNALGARPVLAAKRWVLRSSDRVTTVSEPLRQRAIALGAERVSVLPMGVDTDLFTPLPVRPRRDGATLLFAGRLARAKGVEFAIDAMPRVRARYAHARLLVIGEGPERAALEQRARDAGLGGCVRFLGPLPQHALPQRFAEADVLVGPSVVDADGTAEAFGLVFAEAMASGLPVVASDVGGISAVVRDGETGLLVPQRDAAALADAVLRLLDDPPLRTRLRVQGIASVRERYDRRSIAGRYADLIEEMIAA